MGLPASPSLHEDEKDSSLDKGSSCVCVCVLGGGPLITMATNPHHLVTHPPVVMATEEHHTVTYGHIPKEVSPTLREVKDLPASINYSSIQIVSHFPVP